MGSSTRRAPEAKFADAVAGIRSTIDKLRSEFHRLDEWELAAKLLAQILDVALVEIAPSSLPALVARKIEEAARRGLVARRDGETFCLVEYRIRIVPPESFLSNERADEALRHVHATLGRDLGRADDGHPGALLQRLLGHLNGPLEGFTLEVEE